MQWQIQYRSFEQKGKKKKRKKNVEIEENVRKI